MTETNSLIVQDAENKFILSSQSSSCYKESTFVVCSNQDRKQKKKIIISTKDCVIDP